MPANDGDFGDFGASGVIRGAGVVFFAYVGFDAVSTAAGEARNPQRTVPIGLLGDGAHLDGAVRGDRPRADRHRAVRAPERRPTRSRRRSRPRAAAPAWLDEALGIAAVVGLFSTVLVTFYGQTRILMRMSADGMLPPIFNRVEQALQDAGVHHDPVRLRRRAVAALVPIDVLGELVSIGTLLAFMHRVRRGAGPAAHAPRRRAPVPGAARERDRAASGC